MKNALIRMAAWLSAGALVSFAWGVYFASADKSIPIAPAIFALAKLTEPLLAFFLYLDPNRFLGLTWIIVGNAVTYGLIGLLVETVRQNQHQSLHASR
jgi:hypothetical protein